MKYVATTGYLYNGNLHCWAVGFGIYSPGDKNKVDEVLKKAKVKVYDPQQCNGIYIDKNLQPNYPITRKNICAGPSQLLAVCIALLCISFESFNNESLAFFDGK